MNLARNFHSLEHSFLLDSGAAEEMRRRSTGHRAWIFFPRSRRKGRGGEAIVRKLKRVVNLVGQENDGRQGESERENRPTHANHPFFFIADKFANASVSLPSPRVFSPTPLLLFCRYIRYIYSFSRVRLILFSRVRHDRGGRETSPTLLETTPVMKAINASILLREQVWINRDRVIPRLVVIRPGGTESTNSAN